MKKRILILSLLIVTLLSGCGSTISQEDYDKVVKERDEYKEKYETLLNSITNTEDSSDTSDTSETKEVESNELLQSIEEINQYTWESSGYNYVGIELKNNSTSTIRMDSEFIFYDEGNNIVGTKKDTYVAFEPESDILLYVANEEPFHHFEYNLNPKVDTFNQPVYSKLKNEVSETDNKLIFSVTNTSESEANFVKCTVLFLREDKAVALSYAYAGTSNGKIASSSTERAEIKKPYKIPYDDYILFLDGRL